MVGLPRMALLEIALFGGFKTTRPSGAVLSLPTKKAQALLAYLAVSPGQAHPRDTLATLLWSDMPKPQARASLRQAIFAIRKALHPDNPLEHEGGTLTLGRGAVEVDVERFERLAGEGTREALERAAGLYRGALLEGFVLREAPFEAWLVAERLRLQELGIGALTKLLALQRGSADLEAAAQTAQRLLAIDPPQESVHRVLMRLLVQLGRRGAALRQYQACVDTLTRDLGVEPDHQTKALYQEILASRPSSPLDEEIPRSAVSSAPPIALASEPEGREPPVVGRAKEMALLAQMLDRAWSRQGLVVAITGETGIGKSRMAGEVLAEAGRRGGVVLAGRCHETEQILPFGPWVNAFRELSPDRLAEALGAMRPAWRAELGRLLPEVTSEPPGPDVSPGALRLFEAVAQLLHELAAVQPVVALIEDLHWADEMSIRLLAFLGRRVQKAAVLVVVTVRDEDAARAPLLRETLDELTRGRQALELPLRALSRADTATLTRHLARSAGESPAEAQVWRASEGNPLMVVEMMRAIDGGAVLDGESDLPLPERIRDVVGRRLERLGARNRRLVAVAAAIGRQFELALLQRVAEVTEVDANEGVEELVSHRIFHGVGDDLAFTHDWIREVALALQLPAARKNLHRRIAEALEALPAGDPAAHLVAVGTQYWNAEAWGQAATFFHRAGHATFAQTGRREAVSCYEQALAALARMPTDRGVQERACDVHFSMARALYTTGDFTRSREGFREAEALAQALGDDRREAQILGGLAYLLGSEGEHGDAIEAGDLALSLAQAMGDTATQVWTSVALGRQHFAAGSYRLGAERLAGALEMLRAGPPERRFGPGTLLLPVGARTWRALCLGQLGRFPEAIESGEEAVRLADAREVAQEQAWACYCLGQVSLLRGEASLSQPLLERAVALCEDQRFPIYAPRALAALGIACALRGRLDEALAVLERAAEETAATNLRYGQATVLAMLADAYVATGRHNHARRLAEQSLAIARARGERGDSAWALHLIGSSVAVRTPLDTAEAENALVEALAIASELEMRPLEARTRLGLGRLHLAAGRPGPARVELTRAIADLRAMGMTLWLADADALLGRLA
jgi:DNA-binding SARP family transcriptional activator